MNPNQVTKTTKSTYHQLIIVILSERDGENFVDVLH